jgi:hypothetical protein
MQTIKLIIFMALLVTIAGCQTATNTAPKICDTGIDPSFAYFPAAGFSANEKVNREVGITYARILSSLEEPALLKKRNAGTIRLIAIEGNEQAKMIRVWKKDNVYMVTYCKELDIKSFNNGGAASKKTRKLTEKESEQLEKFLSEIPFQEIAKNELTAVNNDSRWILEANIDTNYKLIDKLNPSAAKLSEFCPFLLKLTQPS